MALYNAYGDTVPSATFSENDNLNLALEFEVTEPNCELAGYRYYNADATPVVKQGRLYDVASQTVIDGPVNFPTAMGRAEVMLGIGVPLTMGNRYKIQVFLPDVDVLYGTVASFHTSEIINGPLHVFSSAQGTQGQGSFRANPTAAYANSASPNSSAYLIEPIIFKPDPSPGAIVARIPTIGDMDRVLHKIAIPATWPDNVDAAEPATGSGIVVRSPAVSSGSTAGGMVVQPQGNESISGAGSTAVDPVANTVVASTASIGTAGLYQVTVQIAHIAGTAVAIDDLNYTVRAGTTPKVTLAVSRTNGVFTEYSDIYLRITAGQTINVVVIGTGTVGIRDSAVIIATKVAD